MSGLASSSHSSSRGSRPLTPLTLYVATFSVTPAASLRLDAALLDAARPFLLLNLQVRGRFFRCARNYGQPALFVELYLLGGGEYLADMRIERLDNRARCSLGRRNHEPGIELVPGHARLGDRRQLRHGGVALHARHGQCAHPSGFDEADLLRNVAEGHSHVAGDERLVRGATPFELHGHDVDVREQVEKLARNVRIGADAGSGIEELTRLRLGERDQLPDGAHRQGRMDGDERWR